MRPVFALIALFLYLLSAGGDLGCAFGRGAAIVRSIIINAPSGDHDTGSHCVEREHEVAACDRQTLIENLDVSSFGGVQLFSFVQYPFITRLDLPCLPGNWQLLHAAKRFVELPVLEKAYLQLRVFRI
ncbi:hypothetical protein DJ568_03145 [Mucilaginibacter hurinus]|uniref:Uncharacterized protein n=1 Tax=Mucilaginibacter hurinus TaxID=2201324 RepID=A0A367GUW0_9SPHI|nr:hypothetical protein [Mucilaginibacter hurinus]RCH56865.1 hypothetical protein DJ568_03145 [Mucilaginibacter hurinus]